MRKIYIKEIERDSDCDISYKIMLDDKEVGTFLTIEDERKFVFIRQISICDEFKRLGIAKQVIDNFVSDSKKPVRFTIATNSKSAILFWNKYLQTTSFKKTNIKENSWQLEK